jgi:hypothetical protein
MNIKCLIKLSFIIKVFIFLKNNKFKKIIKKWETVIYVVKVKTQNQR